jgi:hypothetical protein
MNHGPGINLVLAFWDNDGILFQGSGEIDNERKR